jgi:hypothetical protein
MPSAVSANRLDGCESFILQRWISFPELWRIECPHTPVHAGGSHDAPYLALGLAHAVRRRGPTGDTRVKFIR